mgnify:CR=1 FL=1
MTSTQLAWAVGLFEGEGCMTWRDKAHRRPYLKMAMTDFDVIRKFHELIGVGRLDIIDKKNPKWKDQLQWRTTNLKDCRDILSMFLPQLGDRRAHKALDILDQIECS